jgi:hypothetical protein
MCVHGLHLARINLLIKMQDALMLGSLAKRVSLCIFSLEASALEIFCGVANCPAGRN